MLEGNRFTWLPKFSETFSYLPKDHAEKLCYALVMYGAYGEVTNFEDEFRYLQGIFNAFTEDIDYSVHIIKTREESGSKKKKKKETEENSIEAKNNFDKSKSEDLQKAKNNFDKSKKNICLERKTRQDKTSKTRQDKDIYIPEPEENNYPIQCLKIFDDITGLSYAHLPPECSTTLIDNQKSYSLNDIEKMVRMKISEW